MYSFKSWGLIKTEFELLEKHCQNFIQIAEIVACLVCTFEQGGNLKNYFFKFSVCYFKCMGSLTLHPKHKTHTKLQAYEWL